MSWWPRRAAAPRLEAPPERLEGRVRDLEDAACELLEMHRRLSDLEAAVLLLALVLLIVTARPRQDGS